MLASHGRGLLLAKSGTRNAEGAALEWHVEVPLCGIQRMRDIASENFQNREGLGSAGPGM